MNQPTKSPMQTGEDDIKSVEEAHPQLYHYTTAAGLKGIIESQQLHATNIGFLNDAEEHIGFYKHRLPKLVAKSVDTAFEEYMKSEDFRKEVAKNGDPNKLKEEEVSSLVELIRDNSIQFNEPYVVSFSAPPKLDPEDGLLSQWRAYGPDGGYAIVFDSSKFLPLLTKEGQLFNYQFSTWGDVDYYDNNSPDMSRHPETRKWQTEVCNGLKNHLISRQPNDLESVLEPLTCLSVMHKHRGFAEEAEIRIVVLRPNSEIENAAKNDGEQRPVKPVEFRLRNGTAIPYLALFGKEIGCLPIVKIIVGPHSDKERRKAAVEALLRENGFHVDRNTVITSSIPYLGT